MKISLRYLSSDSWPNEFEDARNLRADMRSSMKNLWTALCSRYSSKLVIKVFLQGALKPYIADYGNNDDGDADQGAN